MPLAGRSLTGSTLIQDVDLFCHITIIDTRGSVTVAREAHSKVNMDTKLKADIAESAVITELLKREFEVLKPYGDRLSYDLVATGKGWVYKDSSKERVD